MTDYSSINNSIDNFLIKINNNSVPQIHIQFTPSPNESSIPFLTHPDGVDPICPNCNSSSLTHISLEPYILCTSCNKKYIDQIIVP